MFVYIFIHLTELVAADNFVTSLNFFVCIMCHVFIYPFSILSAVFFSPHLIG